MRFFICSFLLISPVWGADEDQPHSLSQEIQELKLNIIDLMKQVDQTKEKEQFWKSILNLIITREGFNNRYNSLLDMAIAPQKRSYIHSFRQKYENDPSVIPLLSALEHSLHTTNTRAKDRLSPIIDAHMDQTDNRLEVIKQEQKEQKERFTERLKQRSHPELNLPNIKNPEPKNTD